MSKQIDATKLEKIRESAISLISRNGLANASVAHIAQEAGVSTGYLYRHYAGKEELLNDLLDRILIRISDRIAQLAQELTGMPEAVEGIVRYIFETAEQQPDHVRFCLNLQNDLSVPISHQVIDRLKALCGDIREKGQRTGMIARDITAEDLYITLLCVPLQYVGVRLRAAFKPFVADEAEVNHVAALCLSAIKK